MNEKIRAKEIKSRVNDKSLWKDLDKAENRDDLIERLGKAIVEEEDKTARKYLSDHRNFYLALEELGRSGEPVLNSITTGADPTVAYEASFNKLVDSYFADHFTYLPEDEREVMISDLKRSFRKKGVTRRSI